MVGGSKKRYDRGESPEGGVHSAALLLSAEPPTAKRRGEGVGCGPITPTDYAAVSPEVGHIVMFPGWLFHCVLPLVLGPDKTRAEGGATATLRISAAFNMVLQGISPPGSPY